MSDMAYKFGQFLGTLIVLSIIIYPFVFLIKWRIKKIKTNKLEQKDIIDDIEIKNE